MNWCVDIYANVVHTSVQVHSVHTHTHILIPFADCELTGLKMDIVICVVNSDVCINGLRSLRLHDDFFFLHQKFKWYFAFIYTKFYQWLCFNKNCVHNIVYIIWALRASMGALSPTTEKKILLSVSAAFVARSKNLALMQRVTVTLLLNVSVSWIDCSYPSPTLISTSLP